MRKYRVVVIYWEKDKGDVESREVKNFDKLSSVLHLIRERGLQSRFTKRTNVSLHVFESNRQEGHDYLQTLTFAGGEIKS